MSLIYHVTLQYILKAALIGIFPSTISSIVCSHSLGFKLINHNKPSSCQLPGVHQLGLLWFTYQFVCSSWKDFFCKLHNVLLAWKTPKYTILYRIDTPAFVIINFIQINCKLTYCNLALINNYLPPLLIHTFIWGFQRVPCSADKKELDYFSWRVRKNLQ